MCIVLQGHDNNSWKYVFNYYILVFSHCLLKNTILYKGDIWPRGVLNFYLQLHISDEWFTTGTLASCKDEHNRPNVAQYI